MTVQFTNEQILLFYYLLCCFLLWDQTSVKGVTKWMEFRMGDSWCSRTGFEGEGLWGGWMNLTFPSQHYSVTDSVQLKDCFDLLLFFVCKTCDGAHTCLIKVRERFLRHTRFLLCCISYCIWNVKISRWCEYLTHAACCSSLSGTKPLLLKQLSWVDKC